jgi:squalene synthase HpnC
VSGAADLASGKGHRDENFPVASRLVAPRHRAPIMAFYAFARAADDIADHPTAAPADKLARLDAMRATLVGESDVEPTAAALRAAQAERGLDARHGLDLLDAFRRDVTKTRYADWDELLDYCTVSAMPVGRFVLDVHGEDRALWPANDALCAALQVINHLQDCAKDYVAIDRVYIPADLLADVSELAAARSSPTLRAAILALAVRCRDLLRRSAGFSRAIHDRRLGVEVAVIQRLAEDLTEKLIARDPLSQRVHHRKAEAALLAARAAIPRMLAPRMPAR